MKSIWNQLTAVAVASVAVIATGCVPAGDAGGGNPPPPPPPEIVTQTIDATSYSDFVYYNLETESVVNLTAEQAATSNQWHIGFKRYAVILNGGSSGSGNVSGALAAAQNDFYDTAGNPDNNVFLNATAASEEEHLSASYNLASLTFVADSNHSAIKSTDEMNGTQMDKGWYFYDVATHAITLNANNWWLLRSGESVGTVGSYARFHASSLNYNPSTGLNVTFDFDIDLDGTSGFGGGTASFSAAIPPSGGTQCFDFDSDAVVACTGTAWDLKLEIVGYSWALYTNSGLSGEGNGAALGPIAAGQLVGYATGTTDLFGNSIVSYYAQDMSAGIFSDSPWQEYNLSGQHKLWPNYRVYQIDTDTTDANAPQHKVQIVDYYSGAGASGHVTIRTQLVQ